jgi:flagellar hook-associated protein 3 FlgL
MAVSVPGNNVFQANGNDVFNTLSNLVTLLNTPITDATTQAAFNTGLTNGLNSLQGSLNNVLNIRASVGSNLNEIDSLNTYGSDRDLQYSKTLSGLQDLDYNSALSDLSKNQTILTAAQKSFVTTTNLSLFSLI